MLPLIHYDYYKKCFLIPVFFIDIMNVYKNSQFILANCNKWWNSHRTLLEKFEAPNKNLFYCNIFLNTFRIWCSRISIVNLYNLLKIVQISIIIPIREFLLNNFSLNCREKNWEWSEALKNLCITYIPLNFFNHLWKI